MVLSTAVWVDFPMSKLGIPQVRFQKNMFQQKSWKKFKENDEEERILKEYIGVKFKWTLKTEVNSEDYKRVF